MKRTIGEVLDQIFNTSSVSQRIEILKMNDNKQFRKFLKYALDPTIKFAIPPGTPPYKKSGQRAGFSSSNIAVEMELFYRFVMPHPTEKFHKTFWGPEKKRAMKREQFFVGTLESLDNRESDYLIQMKDKKLHAIGDETNTLTADVVNLAFPKLLPVPQLKEEERLAKAVEKIEPLASSLVAETKATVGDIKPHPAADGVSGSISKKVKEAARERRKYLASKEKDKAKKKAKKLAAKLAKQQSMLAQPTPPPIVPPTPPTSPPVPDYGTTSKLVEVHEDYGDVSPADPAIMIDPGEFLIKGK